MKQLCVITGVAGDVGSALCKTFINNGYKVFGIDRVKPSNLSEIDFYKSDLEKVVTNKSSSGALFKAINNWKGSKNIKVLINNAAYQFLSKKHPIDITEFNRTLNINTVAPYILISKLASDLEKSNGSAINISSIHAKLTKPGFSLYASSKAALSMLTKSLAIDYGNKFRINCIEPAAIDTKMLRDSFNNNKKIKELKSYHPQNKIAKPRQVAQLALKMCNSDIEFLHGSCIEMSGAISSRLHDPE